MLLRSLSKLELVVMLALLKQQEFHKDVSANEVLGRLKTMIPALNDKGFCLTKELACMDGMRIMRHLQSFGLL